MLNDLPKTEGDTPVTNPQSTLELFACAYYYFLINFSSCSGNLSSETKRSTVM